MKHSVKVIAALLGLLRADDVLSNNNTHGEVHLALNLQTEIQEQVQLGAVKNEDGSLLEMIDE